MTLLPGDWAHWGGLAFSFTGKKQPLPGLPGSPTAARTPNYPIPMSLLTSVTSPFLARRPDMPSWLGLAQPWCPADAGMPPAGLWLSMLVCVSMLCTCFVVYISRMDWRKAAEEVTHAPHCAPPAGRSLVLWPGSQQDQTAPRAQPCRLPWVPSKTQRSRVWDCGHIRGSSSSPYVRSTASKCLCAPCANLGWGHEAQSRQGDRDVPQPYSPEHRLVPQLWGCHLSSQASFTCLCHFQPDEPHER